MGISANVEPSNDTVPLPPFPSWRDCTIATCEYDFRKGQAFAAAKTFAAELGRASAEVNARSLVDWSLVGIVSNNFSNFVTSNFNDLQSIAAGACNKNVTNQCSRRSLGSPITGLPDTPPLSWTETPLTHQRSSFDAALELLLAEIAETADYREPMSGDEATLS